jgi:hypothetical protein
VGATRSASLERRRCGTRRTCWNEVERKPAGQSAQAGIPGGEHGRTGQVERWTGRAVAGDGVVRCACCHGEAARGKEGRYAGAAREESPGAESRPEGRGRSVCNPEEGRHAESGAEGCGKPKAVSQIGRRSTRREQDHEEVGGEEECEEGNSDGPTAGRQDGRQIGGKEDGRQIGGKEDDRQGGGEEGCRQVGSKEGCGEKAVCAQDDLQEDSGREDSQEDDGQEEDGHEEDG